MSQFSFDPFPGGDTVAKYVTRYRRSDVPPFEIAAPLDLFPSQLAPAGFTPQLTWEHPWPFGDRAGVYLIYSVSFELIYVGKAQYLGARLSQHFGAGKTCFIRENFGPQPPRFIINIAMPMDMPFEAPALEAYLIGELQPIGNIYGK